MHGLGQFDLPTAIGLCKALEPSDPVSLGDPLPFTYSDAGKELRRSTKVRF